MVDRARSESGFALIELLAAMLLINIGILAILLSLNSGMVTLRRTAEASTSAAVADRQLERFRAIRFSSIFLDSTALAAADATYTGDASYSAAQVSQACSPLVETCTPSQEVTGPDGRTYRVDTFIVEVAPAGGVPVKQVTVVVRKPGDPKTLARVVSTFGSDF
jgi:Tfp pilus assembly protein PilV